MLAYFHVEFRLRQVVRVSVTQACAVLSAIMILSCSPRAITNHSVKFVVSLESPASGHQVYLTGDKPQLGNWNTSAVPLTRVSDSLWSTTLTFHDGERIEFKVTAGLWWTQALDTSGAVYDNFKLNVKRDTVIVIRVGDWLNAMRNGRPVFTLKRFRSAAAGGDSRRALAIPVGRQ